MSLHIGAKDGENAERVLLPGDPLRAEHIAKTFLTDSFCYTTTRSMFGFTGYYKGERVSVQATGMGMPSFSIYASELIDSYNVKELIRVGSCGTISEDLKLRDVLIVNAADTDSGMNIDRFSHYQYAPTASFKLLSKAYNEATRCGYSAKVGKAFTSDQFYDLHAKEKMELASSLGVLGVDMETAELYTLSALKNVDALALLTVSDSILTGENLPALERQERFDEMVELALAVFFN